MTHGRKPKLPHVPVVPALADQDRAQDDAAPLRPVRARPLVGVPVIGSDMLPAQPGAEGSYGAAGGVAGETRSVVIERLQTVSTLNQREHWRARAKRAQTQRLTTKVFLQRVRRPVDAARITIHLVRVAPRRLDSDNLQGALKSVRDGVADWLGIDDGSDRLDWTYAQELSGGAGLYAVRIEVTPC